MCVCACMHCIPHEVENQPALVKRTSQIMKNGQDAIIQMGSK